MNLDPSAADLGIGGLALLAVIAALRVIDRLLERRRSSRPPPPSKRNGKHED